MGLISRVSSRTYRNRLPEMFRSSLTLAAAKALAKPKRPAPAFGKWLNSDGNRDKIKKQVLKEKKLPANAKLPMKEVFKAAGVIWNSPKGVPQKDSLLRAHKMEFETYKKKMAAYKQSL